MTVNCFAAHGKRLQPSLVIALEGAVFIWANHSHGVRVFSTEGSGG